VTIGSILASFEAFSKACQKLHPQSGRVSKFEIGPGFQPPEAVPGSLMYEECRLLWEIAADRTVIEMGTSGGRSTVCLAQRARRVVTIDAGDQTEAIEWVQRFGVAERVEFRQGDVVGICSASGDEFSLALVNTEKDAETLRRKIEVVSPKLAHGDLVAIHNYPDPKWPHVRKIVDEFVNRLEWKRVAQAGY
jgi:predicted O-methyltransferase YrrM